MYHWSFRCATAISSSRALHPAPAGIVILPDSLSSVAARCTSLSGGRTTDAEVEMPKVIASVGHSRRATSPGRTITATPRFVIAVRMAITRIRGILLRLRDEFAVIAAFLKYVLRMRFLKITAANFLTKYLTVIVVGFQSRNGGAEQFVRSFG